MSEWFFCAELNSNERKEENLSWPTEFTPRTHSLIQPLTFISYLRKTHSQAGSTNTTLDLILLESGGQTSSIPNVAC